MPLGQRPTRWRRSSQTVWTCSERGAHNWRMPSHDFDTDSLARYLHVSPAQVQKLAERGGVPARKIGGQWRFSRAEIHHWLEERIGAAGEADLEHVQGLLDQAAASDEPATVTI